MDTTMKVMSGLDLRLARVAQDVKQQDVDRAAEKGAGWASRLESRRVVPEDQAQRYLVALAALTTSVDPAVA